MLIFEADHKKCPLKSGNNQACVSSDCMLWVKDGEVGVRPNGQIVIKDNYGDVQWLEDGHCGLINKEKNQ